MDLKSVINNSEISTKIKDIYEFINKNENKFNDIFDRSYADIKNIFSNVSKTNNTIEIPNIDINELVSMKNDCHTLLIYHAREILKEDCYIISYAFAINILKNTNTIIIKKKY